MESARSLDLEGIIAKHRRSTYVPGTRSKAWLKIKNRPEQELVVGGFTPGEGAAKELGAIVVGVYEREGRKRKLRFAGKVGSGFNAVTRKRIRERLAKLEVAEPPFDPPPPKDYKGRWGGDLAGVRWVKPEIVIRAELGGWTRDDLVRQAAFKGFDEGGKPARDVVRERPVVAKATVEAVDESMPEENPPELKSRAKKASKTPKASKSPDASKDREHGLAWSATTEELAALDAMNAEGTWTVGGFELKLTNLDKVLFPPRAGEPEPDGSDPNKGALPAPVTKRELVRYFARIAPAMLPHLAERPLNLQRFPNGPQAQGFWQKDIPSTAPSWLRRWKEIGVEERQANEHLIADRVATLAWLGNQAPFEVHAWTSRPSDPKGPTFAPLHLHPGQQTTWDD